MPLANRFLKRDELGGEKKYDLAVGFCPDCFLVQLMETVPPKDLFSEYLYFSSTSASFLEHCRVTADYLTEKLKLGPKSLVLEIASNDGAFLQYFKQKNIGILGIDPAKNIAGIANRKGIKTMPEFFNRKLAEKLSTEGIAADLIYGANVLAHVPEIVDFVGGVKLILKPKGTAIFEFPYIAGLIEGKFDTIYHEHVFYYSLLALKNIFQRAGLDIYDVEMLPVQGGSLRIYVSHPGNFKTSGHFNNLEKEELESGFDKIETYEIVSRKADELKKALLTLLEKIKKEGKSVAAYGAPAKGNILLNYFGIGENYLDFIVDKSPAKRGLYTPGTHLPVNDLSKIYEDAPDYLLVLCWNIANEVINMKELESWRRQGGKFIIPIPQIKIL